MPTLLRVRALTAGELPKVEKLAPARKAAAGLVQRARIIWRSQRGYRVAEIATEVELSEHGVRLWIKRFNERGLVGLDDVSRSGRPATSTADEISVVETALTKPEAWGLSVACWPLDRRTAYLNEATGIGIKRARSDEVLHAGGPRWRMQETWFRERVAPDFAGNKGGHRRALHGPARGQCRKLSRSDGPRERDDIQREPHRASTGRRRATPPAPQGRRVQSWDEIVTAIRHATSD